MIPCRGARLCARSAWQCRREPPRTGANPEARLRRILPAADVVGGRERTAVRLYGGSCLRRMLSVGAGGAGDRRLLLKIDLGAGHGGASGRYDALPDRAFEYAFVLDSVGSARR